MDGAVALGPNAAGFLDRPGVYEKLTPQGFVHNDVYFTDTSGWVIGKYANRSPKRYGYSALRILRSTVHSTIVQMCEES